MSRESHVDASSLFDLYVDPGFLSKDECAEIIAQMNGAPASPAPVYGHGKEAAVDERVRKVTRVALEGAAARRVQERLAQAREAIGTRFAIELANVEPLQFLRYGVGDFFVAHQDGATRMLRSEREQGRKVSVVIFLNRRADAPTDGQYTGGVLRFTEWRPGRPSGQYDLPVQAGTLVAFRAETTHEVTPVECGERYSIASWFG